MKFRRRVPINISKTGQVNADEKQVAQPKSHQQMIQELSAGPKADAVESQTLIHALTVVVRVSICRNS